MASEMDSRKILMLGTKTGTQFTELHIFKSEPTTSCKRKYNNIYLYFLSAIAASRIETIVWVCVLTKSFFKQMIFIFEILKKSRNKLMYTNFGYVRLIHRFKSLL